MKFVDATISNRRTFENRSAHCRPRAGTRTVHAQCAQQAADVNADYTIRPEPSETLTVLEVIRKT